MQVRRGEVMSWGERSCKWLYKDNKCKPSPLTCNVDCKLYEWDGKTKPDSKKGCQALIRSIIDGSAFRVKK